MRKLFSLLLSFHLILAPVAFAQEDAYTAKGTGDKKANGGYDFYTKQIGIIATSALGASILTQCLSGLKVPSIATFMAGSLVQIGSEILGAKEKNEQLKLKSAERKVNEEKLVTKGDVSQKEMLKEGVKEEEDLRDFIRKRKQWMIAVTVIYAASMGLAIAEQVYATSAANTNGMVTCGEVALEMATSQCAAATVVSEGCIPAAEEGLRNVCSGVQAAGNLAAQAAFPSEEAKDIGESTCTGPFIQACKDALDRYVQLAYGACNDKPRDGGMLMRSYPMILAAAYGFGMSKVSGGQISQYGSMFISLLSMVVPSLSKIVVKAYNFPVPRAATFGAIAALSGSVTTGLAQRESDAEANIAKMDAAIQRFAVDTEGEGGTVPGPSPAIPPSDDEKPEDPNKPKIKPNVVKPSKTCISDSSGSLDVSSKACIKPIKFNRPNFNNAAFPAISNVSGMASEMANALASGNTGKAELLAGQIGGLAARVAQENEKLKSQYNASLKKDKKSPIDFDKGIKEQVAAIQASVNQGAKDAGVNMSSLASSSPVSGVKDVPVEKSSSSGASSVSAAPTITLPNADLSLGGSENGSPDLDVSLGAAASTQSLDDFESSAQDISKEPEVSIFKQVSNRYILNYTKMFDRKPEVEEVKPKK